MTRVLIARGHQATPWELRQWERLPGRFDVTYLRTRRNGWDTGAVALAATPVRTRRDLLPPGRIGDAVALLVGDRYTRGAAAAFARADIVHAEELAYWFSADAARRKARDGFALVQTVWETLPLGTAYRRPASARNRALVLAATDLFLAATERARTALLLEGVDEERVLVCPPGIDTERFAPAPAPAPEEHVLLSPGRLEWQKGHHDVLRALALLAREGLRPRLRIVGAGAEEGRLRRHAGELGVASQVEIVSVPYDAMPGEMQAASALVLASQGSATGGFHPFDVPRMFWEEQFGMVFAEAMAAGLAIVSTTSGAIPEVLAGAGELVPPGDPASLARALAGGPLARAPGERVVYPAELVARYSLDAAAERLAAAYDRVLSGS